MGGRAGDPGADECLHRVFHAGVLLFLLHAAVLLRAVDGHQLGWRVALLNHRSINFCMRVDNSDTSFTCVRQLLRSGERERRPCLSNCPGSGLSFHQRDIEFLRQYRELLICLIIAEQ